MIQKILVGESYQSKGKGTALVTRYDPVMNMYKVLYSNGEIEFVNEYGLATHIDNINSTEYDLYETFTWQDDMKAYVAQYNNEEELRRDGAIDFAKWLAKEWMSIWVVDKWMWEYQQEEDPTEYRGYKTEEELYELYLKDNG